MAIKSDMSKAYDRLEWEFIRMVLTRLGFHQRWINWVMQCVSTVSYSILINEEPRGYVVPSRGIRQGDPLSPYIFILCSEVLSGLCSNAHVNGSLKGLRVSRGGPRLNHLLFADDTMFFCHTSKENTSTLLKIISQYCSASGQSINTDKSSISFSRKTPKETRDRVKLAMNIRREGGVGKYLGLPEHFGRRKKDLFTGIVDKIRQKAISWSSRFLSHAGKLVMLKSVLSSMPAYAMSCFKLPDSLSKRIQSALTRFWWDTTQDKRKMSWISWDKMTQHKAVGGLGFRDVTCFNDAMLAKLSWRILNNPSSLLARILLSKYCIHDDFLDCFCPSNASHGWRSLLIGKDLLRKNLGWAVGNGKTIHLWRDSWLSTSAPTAPMGPAAYNDTNLVVADLFDETSRDWDIEKIKLLFPHLEATITSIKPSYLEAPDKRVWLKEKSGVYTTKSGYYAALEEKPKPKIPCSLDWNADIWSLKVPPKIKTFLWRTANQAIPVGERLAQRVPGTTLLCPRCNQVETIPHLLFQCVYAANVWDHAPFASPAITHHPTFEENWKETKNIICLPPAGVGSGPLAPWIAWNLWKARNNLLYNKRDLSATELVSKSISEAREWLQGQACKTKVTLPMVRRVNLSSPTDVICQTDGAWNQGTKQAGLGWIFDYNGVELQEYSASAQGVESPLMAEALAIRAALSQAADKEIRNISVESDSLQMVRAINSGSCIANLYGVLSDIAIIAKKFDHVVFSFIPRAANVMAGSLAKSALCNAPQNLV